MAAKLTFNDVENAELDPSKLNFDSGFANALNSGTSDPVLDSAVGALYINTTTGNIFRKIAAGASNWKLISSTSTTVLENRYRSVIHNTAVTATDTTAPAIGDLVAYCGAGAWSTSGVLSIAKSQMAGAGSANATLVAGGQTSVVTDRTELFNGSTWSSGGVLSIAKRAGASAGSQNAGLVAGGVTALATNATELFNGSAWSTGGVLSVAKSDAAGSGSQNAMLFAGGTTGGFVIATELFNGATWSTSGSLSIAKTSMVGAGSQNAGLVAGGTTVGAVTNATELFNGSAWSTGGVLSLARQQSGGGGSQNAALAAGGTTATGGSESALTNLFNGSSWSTSGALTIAKRIPAGAGAQNAGLVAGGVTSASTDATELHVQTIFRKVFTKNYADAKNIGILSTTNSVLIQGTNTSVTYIANKYLVMNRSANASVTNYANLTALSLGSVLGTAPTMTYNLSATANLLTVRPGMMAIVTAGGGTPASAANVGTFLVSRVISPSSFELTNASGVSQNPATGTITIISTMIAVDNASPQDIVIGKTDTAGLLTIQKPLFIGSLIQRLR